MAVDDLAGPVDVHAAVAVALLAAKLNVNEDLLFIEADAAYRHQLDMGRPLLQIRAQEAEDFPRARGQSASAHANVKGIIGLGLVPGADLLLQLKEFIESAQAGTPKVGVPGHGEGYVRRKMGNPISLPMGFRQL